MSDLSNEGRSERAARALGEYDQEDLTADITDLLTDLRHLCAEMGIIFEECVATSEMHFDAEQDGEEALT